MARPTVLLTGTSSGFGWLASVAFAKQGYDVMATMRNLDKKERLTSLAQQQGVLDRITLFSLDVTNNEDIEAVVKAIIDRFGKIDVLVNNAGYAIGGYVEDIPLEIWRAQFDTNFFGLVAVTQAVLPHMRKRRSGMIINMSSRSGRIGLPGIGPYVASKFAVEGFSETLRLEMLPYGVRVVLIEPGSYKTEIWEKGIVSNRAAAPTTYEKEIEILLKNIENIAETADDPEKIAQLMTRVAASDAPKLRYPMGTGVKSGLRLKTVLPWKWLEKIIMKKLTK